MNKTRRARRMDSLSHLLPQLPDNVKRKIVANLEGGGGSNETQADAAAASSSTAAAGEARAPCIDARAAGAAAAVARAPAPAGPFQLRPFRLPPLKEGGGVAVVDGVLGGAAVEVRPMRLRAARRLARARQRRRFRATRATSASAHTSLAPHLCSPTNQDTLPTTTTTQKQAAAAEAKLWLQRRGAPAGMGTARSGGRWADGALRGDVRAWLAPGGAALEAGGCPALAAAARGLEAELRRQLAAQGCGALLAACPAYACCLLLLLRLLLRFPPSLRRAPLPPRSLSAPCPPSNAPHPHAARPTHTHMHTRVQLRRGRPREPAADLLPRRRRALRAPPRRVARVRARARRDGHPVFECRCSLGAARARRAAGGVLRAAVRRRRRRQWRWWQQ